MSEPAAPADRRKAKPPRRITAASLENSALFYLQRFDSTAENLRRVLDRKVRRAAAKGAEIDAAEVAAWIAETVAKMVRLGYVDDTRTATVKARGLFARGAATGTIRRRLQMAGAPEEAIDAAFEDLERDEGENLDVKAALALARRRRLGPYRDAAGRAERRDRDLAALARAGFDYDTARRVVDADDPDELLED